MRCQITHVSSGKTWTAQFDVLGTFMSLAAVLTVVALVFGCFYGVAMEADRQSAFATAGQPETVSSATHATRQVARIGHEVK